MYNTQHWIKVKCLSFGPLRLWTFGPNHLTCCVEYWKRTGCITELYCSCLSPPQTTNRYYQRYIEKPKTKEGLSSSIISSPNYPRESLLLFLQASSRLILCFGVTARKTHWVSFEAPRIRAGLASYFFIYIFIPSLSSATCMTLGGLQWMKQIYKMETLKH